MPRANKKQTRDIQRSTANSYCERAALPRSKKVRGLLKALLSLIAVCGLMIPLTYADRATNSRAGYYFAYTQAVIQVGQNRGSGATDRISNIFYSEMIYIPMIQKIRHESLNDFPGSIGANGPFPTTAVAQKNLELVRNGHVVLPFHVNDPLR